MTGKTDEKVVDAELARELATGHVSAAAILEALEGFGEKRARGLVKWACRTSNPEAALAAWGLKDGAAARRRRSLENARRRGRTLALEGTLRAAFRKRLAAEHLGERRLPEAPEEPPAESPGYVTDEERIARETHALKTECAEEYPPEAFEEDLGFDPASERELERRLASARSGGAPLSREDWHRLEVYDLAADALASELGELVTFLEKRLEKALTGYLRDPGKHVRCEVEGLPYEPRERDR